MRTRLFVRYIRASFCRIISAMPIHHVLTHRERPLQPVMDVTRTMSFVLFDLLSAASYDAAVMNYCLPMRLALINQKSINNKNEYDAYNKKVQKPKEKKRGQQSETSQGRMENNQQHSCDTYVKDYDVRSARANRREQKKTSVLFAMNHFLSAKSPRFNEFCKFSTVRDVSLRGNVIPRSAKKKRDTISGNHST